MIFKRNQELPVYEVVAENYARLSENKIHSQDVAQKLGFTGGLVPGVEIYTYMAQPLITSLGSDWLERGVLSAKFIKPVYEEEKVTIQSKVTSIEPLTVEIEARNSNGDLCAVGSGGLSELSSEKKIAAYPPFPLPEFDNRFPARAAELKISTQIGSINVEYHPEDTSAYFFIKHRDLIPELSVPTPMHHPAFFLHIANCVMHYNIKLGPWIHTSSEVQHHNLPAMNSTMQMNGKILDAYERKGNEFAVLDLGVFTDASLPIVSIKHTAIIKPKGV